MDLTVLPTDLLPKKNGIAVRGNQSILADELEVSRDEVQKLETSLREKNELLQMKDQAIDMLVKRAESQSDLRTERDRYKEQAASIGASYARVWASRESLKKQVALLSNNLKKTMESRDILLDQVFQLQNPEITFGSKVWSKSTGLGPYVVLGEAGEKIGGVKIGPTRVSQMVAAWVVRGRSGADLLMPVDDATLEPHRFAVISYIFWCIVFFTTLGRIK